MADGFPPSDPSIVATGLINRLQNASFALNPEGTSSPVDTGTVFVNWTVLTQTGAAQASQLSAPEAGQSYAIRLTQTQASAQRMGLAQTVQFANCSDLRTALMSASGRVRYSTPANVRFALLEWDGTADASPVDVVHDWASALYVPGQFFVSSVSVVGEGIWNGTENAWSSLPYIPLQGGTGLNNLIFFIWTQDALSQNGTLDLGALQVSLGNDQPYFEHRPIQLDQALDPTYISTLLVLPTIAALKAKTGGYVQGVEIEGYYTPGDGGGGFFYWDATSGASDNGGTIIASNAGGAGRWLRPVTGANGVVNVRQFGAKGDQSQDDQPFIQKAASAIGANGGMLWIPPGDYKVASETALTTGMIVAGPGNGQASGSAATLRSSSATASIFNVTTAQGVVFRDLAFGASVARTGGASIFITSDGVSANLRTRVENCYFQGEWVCVNFSAARFWVVTECVCDQFGAFGIFYSNNSFADAGDNAVTSNVFVGANGSLACCHSESAAGIWWTGNKFFGAQYGIQHNAKASTGTLQIVGNSFEEQANAHIIIQQATVGAILGQVNINANEFSILSLTPANPTLYIAPGGSGQYVHRVNISDNVFNNAYNINLNVISVQDGDGVMISNNVFDLTSQALPGSITVGGNATNVQVLDNEFVNQTSAQHYKNGLTSTTVVRDNPGLAFADVGGWGNGSQIYCTDGTAGSPLTGSGSGSMAFRINGAWKGI